MHSFLEIRIVIIVIKRKEHALQCPYQTRARARVMSEIEEVQEQMKADMEAMKKKIAMLSMKKIMEVNMAAVATTSAAAEVDPTKKVIW